MIGKGKSISHASNAIDYAKEKQGAVEISRNNVIGENGKEIAKEFRVFQNLNARCQRNTISFVLSPSIPVGNKLTNQDFKNLSDDFLSRMNLKENQSITFLHCNKDHQHLHIFVNRIDYNGRAYKDHFISKKAQRIAESMVKARGFKTAKEIQIEKETRLRTQIKEAHSRVLLHNPRNIFEYAEMMQHLGIRCHLKQASNGKVVGLKFHIGKESIKASSVDRSFSAARLQKLIQQNFEHHIRYRNQYRKEYQRNQIDAHKNKFRI
ncbi:relaxase/mobilization nuclease domain-containing protein [uncultured Draconibacterium sp.]|uniref:relaxase/mobilization nuclease domain-containing protein n=1 Tax=uncultured Draconibacterium sp. TaxID=1573823 RepID=UPI0032614FD2